MLGKFRNWFNRAQIAQTHLLPLHHLSQIQNKVADCHLCVWSNNMPVLILVVFFILDVLFREKL